MDPRGRRARNLSRRAPLRVVCIVRMRPKPPGFFPLEWIPWRLFVCLRIVSPHPGSKRMKILGGSALQWEPFQIQLCESVQKHRSHERPLAACESMAKRRSPTPCPRNMGRGRLRIFVRSWQSSGVEVMGRVFTVLALCLRMMGRVLDSLRGTVDARASER